MHIIFIMQENYIGSYHTWSSFYKIKFKVTLNPSWEMFMRYISFLTMPLTVAKIRTMLLNEERLNGELQKILQDKIELRELDRLKSTFLANVSHELRTPMSSIIGYIDLLLDKVDGHINEEQEKSLKKVALHSKHLLQLINSLLDISKMESGELKLEVRKIDLKSLIETVTVTFDSLIKQKGLTLFYTLFHCSPPGMHQSFLKPTPLEQKLV